MPAVSYKLPVPNTRNQVPRQRQVQALDGLLATAPIVWVLGLPGAGKTCTAAQWVHAAQARGERCIWYRLDEDDADIAGLIGALRQHPQHGNAALLPAWSPDNQPDPRRFAQRFFSQLANAPKDAPKDARKDASQDATADAADAADAAEATADAAGADAAPASGNNPPPRLTLVFDDCHRVPDQGVLFEMLDAAREVAGDSLRLLLISRRPPPPPLSRGTLTGWLQLYDDLALSLDEAAAVAQGASGRVWTATEIDALRQAQGWMAHVLALARGGVQEGGAQPGGVQVGQQAHQVHGRPAARTSAGGTSGGTQAASPAVGAAVNPAVNPAVTHVGEFLCHELLLMLPAADRRGFRLLAELPEVPRTLPAVAAAAARLLDQLAARRYFVDVTASDAWRLHDLLRDGLRAHNALVEAPDALAAARRERAAWVLAQSPETAMNLLVAAADTEGALALLHSHGRNWLAQGRHGQLLHWLHALPDAGNDAQALLWRAEALLPGTPEEARPLFARSRALLMAAGPVGSTAKTAGPAAGAAGAADPAPDVPGAGQDVVADAYRAWCGEVASYVVQWGAVQGLAELVDELELLELRLGPAPGDWRLRTAADALTALMYGRAEDVRIRRYAEATALAVQQAPDAGSRIMAAAQLLIYRLWWAGDFPGGRALYDTFDAEVDADSGALAPLAKLIWWSNAAIIDWQCGDPARCHSKVERGLALAEASGVHVRDFFLLTQGIFCALSQEDWPRAEGYLTRLALTGQSHHFRHRRLDAMVHHFFRSWYCLSRGDAATALAHAQTALPMAEALGSLFHKVIVLSALAPAALHAGDLATAQQAYRTQLALAKGSQNLTFAYIAFCAGAEIALVSGDTDALRKQVERMLTVKQLGGFHSDCGWRTPVRARLLAFALEHGVLPDVARQWIVQKRVPPPAGISSAAARLWPMPVQIQALSGLVVKVHGQETDDGAKPASRLRELLAVLVARRHGATQGELCDWLWPDADGDKAAASLKMGVHRLRGWLGHDAVTVRNGTVALNLLHVACDLWWHEEHEPQALAANAAQVLAGSNAPPVAQLRQRLAGAGPASSARRG